MYGYSSERPRRGPTPAHIRPAQTTGFTASGPGGDCDAIHALRQPMKQAGGIGARKNKE